MITALGEPQGPRHTTLLEAHQTSCVPLVLAGLARLSPLVPGAGWHCDGSPCLFPGKNGRLDSWLCPPLNVGLFLGLARDEMKLAKRRQTHSWYDGAKSLQSKLCCKTSQSSQYAYKGVICAGSYVSGERSGGIMTMIRIKNAIGGITAIFTIEPWFVLGVYLAGVRTRGINPRMSNRKLLEIRRAGKSLGESWELFLFQ